MSESQAVCVAEPRAQQYQFDWNGETFEAKGESSSFEGKHSASKPGTPWLAYVAVEGWRWVARMQVGGGWCSGIGSTPWQALDAVVTAWQDQVAKLVVTK